MPYQLRYFLYYVGIMWLLSIIATVYDKKQSTKQHRYRKHNVKRIPETALFSLAVLGGAMAMYAAMLIVHHKTQKPKFKYGIPVIAFLHIALLVFIYTSLNLNFLF